MDYKLLKRVLKDIPVKQGTGGTSASLKDLPHAEKVFVQEAEAAGLINLKGHRSVGGMRASIYNAMPMQGVEKLVAFMKDFQAKH